MSKQSVEIADRFFPCELERRESLTLAIDAHAENVRLGENKRTHRIRDYRDKEELEAERAKAASLQERIDDYEHSARKILNSECATDELHCSCVPTLMVRVKELEQELNEEIKNHTATAALLGDALQERDELKNEVKQFEKAKEIAMAYLGEDTAIGQWAFDAIPRVVKQRDELEAQNEKLKIERDLYGNLTKKGSQDIVHLCNSHAELKAQNARLVDVLEFYADGTNYEYCEGQNSICDQDCGQRGRDVLANKGAPKQ